jgi:hypothetical protein
LNGCFEIVFHQARETGEKEIDVFGARAGNVSQSNRLRRVQILADHYGLEKERLVFWLVG